MRHQKPHAKLTDTDSRLVGAGGWWLGWEEWLKGSKGTNLPKSWDATQSIGDSG